MEQRGQVFEGGWLLGREGAFAAGFSIGPRLRFSGCTICPSIVFVLNEMVLVLEAYLSSTSTAGGDYEYEYQEDLLF